MCKYVLRARLLGEERVSDQLTNLVGLPAIGDVSSQIYVDASVPVVSGLHHSTSLHVDHLAIFGDEIVRVIRNILASDHAALNSKDRSDR